MTTTYFYLNTLGKSVEISEGECTLPDKLPFLLGSLDAGDADNAKG